MTQFTDTSTSSSGAKASSSNAARKLLSRLNFRENKSSSPHEDSEASVEADRHRNASSPVNTTEDSGSVVTKESEGTKSLDTGDSNLSSPESGATARSAQSSNLKSGTSAENSKSAREKAKDSEAQGTMSKPDAVMSKPTKQSSQPNQQPQGWGVPPNKDVVRPKKPAVKVRPQQIVTAMPSSPQESARSGEKTKRELDSPGTLSSTGTNTSSASSSTSASHVSNVIHRMQNSQTSHQQQQQPVSVTRRVAKPAVIAKPGPGPTYPVDNIPGPVKPRPLRKKAPSFHSPRAPRPLSVPNMDDNSSLLSLTSSLPGLTECSKEELELLSELYQKAAANDYYDLLGVDPDATMEELARARREKTRVLHPDHFANDPERQAK